MSSITALSQDQMEEIFYKVRSKIVVNSMGMSQILFYVNPVFRPEIGPAPITTDGKAMFVFQNFFNLPIGEQIFYVLHNTLHAALRHPTRALKLRRLQSEKFNHRLCTLAQDLIINWSLKGQKWIQVPESAVNFERVLTSDVLSKTPPEAWSMESLYKHFLNTLPKTEVDMDVVIPSDPTGEIESPTEEEANDSLWEKRLERAIAGSDPRDALRKLGADVKVSKTPWKVVLKRYLMSALSPKLQANFSRPHRRTSAGVIDYYMPSTQRSKAIKEVAFVVDTSGSISDGDLSKCLCEILAVQSVTASNIRLISADAAVHTDMMIPAEKATLAYVKSIFKESMKGGGGTDFRPAIELLLKKPPSICIYLTDTAGTFPTEAPNYPVIWVSSTDGKAPWGVTLHMSDE